MTETSSSPRMSIAIVWPVDWDGPRQRWHHFAEELAARGHGCLYVEPAHSWATALVRRRRLLRRPFGRVWRPSAGVTVVTLPLTLPFSNRLGAVRRANGAMLRRFLRRVVRRWSFRTDVGLCVGPESLRILEALEPTVVAFDILDDYVTFPGQTAAGGAIAALEVEELLALAGVVFAVSGHLAHRYGSRARRMVYLPNGVDSGLFARALEGEVAAELAALPRPVVGYVGMVQTFFDADTVHALATAHPDYQIVLVGTVKRDLGALASLPNVHVLGFRPYAELPSYVAGFDVAVIPFLLTEASLSANPSKVFQYLAAGRRVVATRMPELEPLGGAIALASSPAEFLAAVEEALAEAPEAGLGERMRIGVEGDWAARADVLEAELQLLLEGA